MNNISAPIPIEVFNDHFFPFLDTQNLANARLVSREWNEYISKKILDDYQEYKTESPLNPMKEIVPELKNSNIKSALLLQRIENQAYKLWKNVSEEDLDQVFCSRIGYDSILADGIIKVCQQQPNYCIAFDKFNRVYRITNLAFDIDYLFHTTKSSDRLIDNDEFEILDGRKKKPLYLQKDLDEEAEFAKSNLAGVQILDDFLFVVTKERRLFGIHGRNALGFGNFEEEGREFNNKKIFSNINLQEIDPRFSSKKIIALQSLIINQKNYLVIVGSYTIAIIVPPQPDNSNSVTNAKLEVYKIFHLDEEIKNVQFIDKEFVLITEKGYYAINSCQNELQLERVYKNSPEEKTSFLLDKRHILTIEGNIRTIRLLHNRKLVATFPKEIEGEVTAITKKNDLIAIGTQILKYTEKELRLYNFTRNSKKTFLYIFDMSKQEVKYKAILDDVPLDYLHFGKFYDLTIGRANDTLTYAHPLVVANISLAPFPVKYDYPNKGKLWLSKPGYSLLYKSWDWFKNLVFRKDY